MAWQELSISVPHEYVEPISYLFSRYGKGLSTQIDDSVDGIRQRTGQDDLEEAFVSAIRMVGDE